MCSRERKDDWGGQAGKPASLGYSVKSAMFFWFLFECSSLSLFKLRLLMEELVNFIERVPKAQSASLWKNKDIQR